MDWDGWLYWQKVNALGAAPITTGAAAAEDFLTAMTGGRRIEVDSKAMRKLEDGIVIFAVMDVTEVGASAMQVHFDSRILLKLA